MMQFIQVADIRYANYLWWIIPLLFTTWHKSYGCLIKKIDVQVFFTIPSLSPPSPLPLPLPLGLITQLTVMYIDFEVRLIVASMLSPIW